MRPLDGSFVDSIASDLFGDASSNVAILSLRVRHHDDVTQW